MSEHTSAAAGGPDPAGSWGPEPSDGAPALECRGLGVRNGGDWVLRDCTFHVPRGRISGLVGPNGDGKSSLLAVAAGLRAPSAGGVRVFGRPPGARGTLPRIGLLMQDRPLHAGFTVAETLRLGRELNPGWDQAAAAQVVRDADVPPTARISALSGGQRSCVALALVLGKRPELLLLDEPLADLDPLRRHAMTAALMTANARHGTTVVLSSHVLAELDLICDHVLLLARGRMLIADDLAFVQAAHTLVTCTRDSGRPGPPPELDGHTVVDLRATGRQLTALVQLSAPLGDAWLAQPPTLEEILLGYLRNPAAPPLPTLAAETRPAS